MDILGIQSNIASALQQAPENLFKGIAAAAMFIPNGLKGVVVFGEGVWNSWTPEEQAIVEKALAKLILQAATAYVGA
jgi:TRAP-type C4-dicarboxylate transport system substrate-binding protein